MRNGNDIHRLNSESPRLERRDFLRYMGGGLLTAGFGTFVQSCAEKEVGITDDLAAAYLEQILSIIGTIREQELENINKAAMFAIQTRLQGNQLFSLMRHGMIPQETARHRPGSPHVFTTDRSEIPSRNDLVVTNEPGLARGFAEQYVKVIGITTPRIPGSQYPLGEYENPGTFRIEDVADVVIFCHVPHTDAVLNVQGIDVPVCPASGIIESLIYYALTAEIVEGFTRSAIYPEIGG